jgi:hypothetical protein
MCVDQRKKKKDNEKKLSEQLPPEATTEGASLVENN